MNVGELREILEQLPDDMWVLTRSQGDLADPSVDLMTDEDGEDVLVIS